MMRIGIRFGGSLAQLHSRFSTRDIGIGLRLLPATVGVLVLTVAAVLTGPAALALTPSQSSPEADKISVLDQINAQRAAYGSPLVTRSSAVEQVAQDWANQLAADPDQPMQHNPYFGQQIGAQYSGEVASKYYDASQVVTKWMLSNAHKPILLGLNYSRIGIGYVHDATTGAELFIVNFASAATRSVTSPGQVDQPSLALTGSATDAYQTTTFTVTAAWSAPSDTGGAPITNYFIQVYDETGRQANGALVDQNARDVSMPIRGDFTHDHTYIAKVSALNGYGTYQWSVASAGLFLRHTWDPPVEEAPAPLATTAPAPAPSPSSSDIDPIVIPPYIPPVNVPSPRPSDPGLVIVGPPAGTISPEPMPRPIVSTQPAPPVAPRPRPSEPVITAPGPSPHPAVPPRPNLSRITTARTWTKIDWASPKNSGATNYSLRLYKGATLVRQYTLPAKRSVKKLTGLKARTSYKVQIVAYNSNGRASRQLGTTFRTR